MFSPLRNPAYRQLFGAQIAALLGTGLATVVLGLLAHEIAGASAGEILGAIFAIKMIAYVAVAPIASAIVAHAPRKALLVTLDVLRAGVAASLPFANETWQIFTLMAVLYVAAAAFTPAFQAMIPDLLPDEREYTKALSLSRLAAELESVASPVLAALLLAIMSFQDLFAGTAIGFAISAAFVFSARLPEARTKAQRPFLRRLTAGLNLFARTPRLSGLLAISLATAAGGAMVFVNTVVLVQSEFELSQSATAWALAWFGLGSMIAALALPRLVEKAADRSVMIFAGAAMALVLAAAPFAIASYATLVAAWFVLGCAYSLTLTPVGRVLRRSAHGEDRPALFAAHFALSHACWLVAYPVAGFVSASFGSGAAFGATAALCAVGVAGAVWAWPAHDAERLPHTHDDLPADHPHLEGALAEHTHEYVIDDLHRRWPR